MPPDANGPVRIFISYSHKDEKLREQLNAHLAPLKNERVIDDWHDRRIIAGEEWVLQSMGNSTLPRLFSF